MYNELLQKFLAYLIKAQAQFFLLFLDDGCLVKISWLGVLKSAFFLLRLVLMNPNKSLSWARWEVVNTPKFVSCHIKLEMLSCNVYNFKLIWCDSRSTVSFSCSVHVWSSVIEKNLLLHWTSHNGLLLFSVVFFLKANKVRSAAQKRSAPIYINICFRAQFRDHYKSLSDWKTIRISSTGNMQPFFYIKHDSLPSSY